GLFANRDFRPGEYLIEYKGEILDEKQKEHRYPHNDAHYVMQIKRDMYIDAVDPLLSSDARYINTGSRTHNNARIKISHRDSQHRANIYASTHIKKGDEIFMPY